MTVNFLTRAEIAKPVRPGDRRGHGPQPDPASDHLIEFINRRSIPDTSASPDCPTHPRLRPLADLLLPTTPVRTALAPPMRLVIIAARTGWLRELGQVPQRFPRGR
jgi:hypothetical protein